MGPVYNSETELPFAADPSTSVFGLFSPEGKPFNVVTCEVNGKHGPFINSKNTKYYYILEGEGRVVIDGEAYPVKKDDFAEILPNQVHFIEGRIRFLCLCTPPYDPSCEQKTAD